MIDYLNDVQPLEPLSDANIALHLSSRTAKAIPCSQARIVLQESGAVIEDCISRNRSGALVEHYTSLADGEEKSLLGWAIAHIWSGEEISTNVYPRSIQFDTVLSGLPDALSEIVKAVVNLGGGRPTPAVTESDVAAAREKHNAIVEDEKRTQAIEQLKAEIENVWINPAMSDGESTAEEVRQFIKAGL